MSKIELQDVAYCYCENGVISRALLDTSLTVNSGEFVCVVGHSGCGKSTLLSLIAGLLKPSCGQVLIDGNQVEGPGPTCAMVFQHYSLFPWMTVQQNVAFSIKHSEHPASASKTNEMVAELLQQVGMSDSADKYPFQLSGGMQQRVAIARALAMRSSVLLLDEPFGALDARNRTELQTLLSDIWLNAQQKPTVVFVTHDLDEAILLADRIVFMWPEHIEREFAVNFPRPRSADLLVHSTEHQNLKSELLDLFYCDDSRPNQHEEQDIMQVIA